MTEARLHVRPFAPADTEAVVALWRECGLTRPWNDPYKDIARKLQVQPELFLVGEVAGAVVSTVMAGYEGHRGWVYYLAVAPAHQRRGCARELMQHVEAALLARGCPKISLLVRSANTAVLDFYARLGYAQDAAVPLGKRLIPDD
jgi:ribosomal protein S18 acetylase RimI-like enzyme